MLTRSTNSEVTAVLPATWEDIYVRLTVEPNDDGAWRALERRVAVWARACFVRGGAHLIDDAIAETCANVVLGLDHARGAQTFSSFVYGHFLNVRRRVLHIMHLPVVERLTDLEIEDPQGEQPELSAVDFTTMWRALDDLPRREALAVRMRYLDDRSSSEIAVALGTTNGNARQILHQALKHLREAIGSHPT